MMGLAWTARTAAAVGLAAVGTRVGALLKGAEHRRHQAVHAELERLRTARRYTPLVTTLLGAPMRIPDGPSFFESYREIFEREIYAFRSTSASPYVVDGGANVGLSVLYFKRRYPKCNVVAFEADPAIHEILETNVRAFGLTGVRLVNKALWNANADVEFAAEGSDGGRICVGASHPIAPIIRVPTTCLRPYLERPVDFLKLDIEGAECDVLTHCADLLPGVRSVFVEYHSLAHEQQRLDEVLAVLRKAGFRIHIHTQMASPQPLLARVEYLGMDLQLNVFGWRS